MINTNQYLMMLYLVTFTINLGGKRIVVENSVTRWLEKNHPIFEKGLVKT